MKAQIAETWHVSWAFTDITTNNKMIEMISNDLCMYNLTIFQSSLIRLLQAAGGHLSSQDAKNGLVHSPARVKMGKHERHLCNQTEGLVTRHPSPRKDDPKWRQERIVKGDTANKHWLYRCAPKKIRTDKGQDFLIKRKCPKCQLVSLTSTNLPVPTPGCAPSIDSWHLLNKSLKRAVN